MAQNDRQLCPVCGVPRDAAGGFGCTACGFQAAFADFFASPASAAFWRAEIQRRNKPLPLVQAMLYERLSFGQNHINLLLDDTDLQVDGVYGETKQDDSILQVSRGDRHTVVLLRDGTVTARGSNEFGQCEVSSLHSIRQVIAASRCTYALRSDGRVQFAGVPDGRSLASEQVPEEALPLLKGWEGIARLACGEKHLAGLTAEGRVMLGGLSPVLQKEIFAEAAELRRVKGIAAAGSCTLALLEDGTVRFLGERNDPRSGVDSWRDIVCVAVESSYAVGLTAEGRILLAGRVDPLLDMGRSDAAKWEHVAAVACDHSAIAAVTAEGELLLAGSVPHAGGLRSAWQRDVLPALTRFLRKAE